MLGAPELDAGLQVGSHESRVEGQNPLPQPAGYASLDAAQDTVGFLGCKPTYSGLQVHFSELMYYKSKFNLLKSGKGVGIAATFPHKNLKLELDKMAQRIPLRAKVGSCPVLSQCRLLHPQKNGSCLLVVFCWLDDLNKLPEWATQYVEEEERQTSFSSGTSR